MKIWVLFSIANDYDQPDANLVSWWKHKPSVEILTEVLGLKMSKIGNEQAGMIWKGKEVRVWDKDYRLECIEEGRYGKEPL